MHMKIFTLGTKLLLNHHIVEYFLHSSCNMFVNMTENTKESGPSN